MAVFSYYSIIMFLKLTSKHKKRILWAAVFLIVPAFVFWGSSTLFDGNRGAIGEIQGRPIEHRDFAPYIDQAQLHSLLNFEESRQPDFETIYSMAGDFYLLAYQAERENIKVSDREVVEHIQNMPLFQENGQFSRQVYDRIMDNIQWHLRRRFSARDFEEHIRKHLKNKKLFEKHIQVEVREQEVKDFYKTENQEAMLSYLFIPYQAWKPGVDVPREVLETFYAQNRSQFRRQSKVKVSFIRLDPGSREAENIVRKLEKISSLDELEGVSVEVSGFFSRDEPIENVGFSDQLNQMLFGLSKGEISYPVELQNNIFVFQKLEETESFFPEFTQILEEVKNAYRKNQARKHAQEVADNILEEIKTSEPENLGKFTSGEKVRFVKTDFFNYLGYIRGLGLSEKVSNLAFFTLEEGEIYQEPIFKENGIYIIRLEEKTEIDPEVFAQEKEEYYQIIRENKEMYRRFSYLSRLRDNLSFRLRPLRQ